MKKLFIMSLLLFIPLVVFSSGMYIDARVGDFGNISRIVLEFTSKIDNNISYKDSTLSIAFDKESYEDAIPLKLDSENIINFNKYSKKSKLILNTKFNFPIKIDTYNYTNEDNRYLVICDVYNSIEDKENDLAKVLYLAQKFSLKKADKSIKKLTSKYTNDNLVNLYLGHLYSRNRNKKLSLQYYSNVSENSDLFAIAKANINKVKNNVFLDYEVKPEYFSKETIVPKVSLSTSTDKKVTSNNKDQQKAVDTLATSNKKQEQTSFLANSIYYIIGLIIIVVIQLIIIIKKSSKSRYYLLENEQLKDELYSLENKLKKGIIHDETTKDRIIVKLYKNGWKPEAIAKELNMSIENINKIVDKLGRM